MVDEAESFDDLSFDTKELDDILSEAKEDVSENEPDKLLSEEKLSEDISEPDNTEGEQGLLAEEPVLEETPLGAEEDRSAQDSDIQNESFSREEMPEAFSYQENPVEENSVHDEVASSEVYPISSENSVGNIGNLRWYSGTSADKVFSISKGFESGEFVADEECKTIHVNVGYDTYGWEVQFSDGIVMNLRDVREYQIRNGKLPSENGRIIFGNSELSFTAVKRIVVYETVKYFSYGI